MSNTGLILAIDGGGTKTDIVMGRRKPECEVEVLVRYAAGPTNLTALGLQAALSELERAIRQAQTEAQVQDVPFDMAIIGLAGAADASLRVALEDWAVRQQLAAQVEVMTDGELILTTAQAAASDRMAAVALISGTGTLAMGRNSAGETLVRAGGWGYLLGDDGSGFAVGRAALRAILAGTEQRGPTTDLLPALYQAAHVDSPRGLVGYVYRQPDPRQAIAALTPIVVEVAKSGDPVAAQILTEAGQDLAELVESVVVQLSAPVEGYALACSGGLLTEVPAVAEALRQSLDRRGRRPSDAYFVKDAALAAVYAIS